MKKLPPEMDLDDFFCRIGKLVALLPPLAQTLGHKHPQNTLRSYIRVPDPQTRTGDLAARFLKDVLENETETTLRAWYESTCVSIQGGKGPTTDDFRRMLGLSNPEPCVGGLKEVKGKLVGGVTVTYGDKET